MMDGKSSQKEKLPQYWDLLTEADKNGYHTLKMAFNAGSIKRNRGHRIETFDGILDAIRRYAEQGNENDWKRSLVCGVCWMDQTIAINTRQLRLLISKCKSSINGSLQKLGFSTNTSHSESWKILFSRIPLLKDNFTEIRQWTIRYKMQPNMVLQVDPKQMHMHPQMLLMQQQQQQQLNNNINSNEIMNIPNNPMKSQITLQTCNQSPLKILNPTSNMPSFTQSSSQKIPKKEELVPAQEQQPIIIESKTPETANKNFGLTLPPLERCPLKFRSKLLEMSQNIDSK